MFIFIFSHMFVFVLFFFFHTYFMFIFPNIFHTGLYVGWRCPEFKHDCQRIFHTSRCFCDHILGEHAEYHGSYILCCFFVVFLFCFFQFFFILESRGKNGIDQRQSYWWFATYFLTSILTFLPLFLLHFIFWNLFTWVNSIEMATMVNRVYSLTQIHYQ